MIDPKPPLGIKPKGLWLQDRAIHLADTISRYLSDGILRPRVSELIAELGEIVMRLSNDQAEAIHIQPLPSLGFRICIKRTLDDKDHTKIVVLRNVDSITSKYESMGGKTLVFSSSIHKTFSQWGVNRI